MKTDVAQIENILKAERLYLKAKSEAEYANKTEELFFRNYLESIVNTVNSWTYSIPVIQRAQEELLVKDKRKKKPNLDLIQWKLVNDFLPKDSQFEIVSITAYGFESYGWEICFRFNSNKEIYAIYIPDNSKLTVDNFKYAYEGKFQFLHKISDSGWEIEKQSYDISTIADYIKENIAEKKDKNYAKEE